MYYVRYLWRHKFHSVDEITYWNNRDNAEEKFGSILVREYKTLFQKKPSKFLSMKDIFECIDKKLSDMDDYSFVCECCLIIAEDHEDHEDDEEEVINLENHKPSSG